MRTQFFPCYWFLIAQDNPWAEIKGLWDEFSESLEEYKIRYAKTLRLDDCHESCHQKNNGIDGDAFEFCANNSHTIPPFFSVQDDTTGDNPMGKVEESRGSVMGNGCTY